MGMCRMKQEELPRIHLEYNELQDSQLLGRVCPLGSPSAHVLMSPPQTSDESARFHRAAREPAEDFRRPRGRMHCPGRPAGLQIFLRHRRCPIDP